MWVFYTLVSAFGIATSDLFAKDVMVRGQVEERPMIWLRYAFALPVIVPLLLSIQVPPLDRTFWLLHLVWLPVELAALLLYMRAIHISPLSLTVPFLSVTPIFVIPWAFLMMRELPSLLAVFGILLIVAGSYILNADKKNQGFFSPFRAILRERGSLLMLIVAFLYSVTAVIGKMLIQSSSPRFYSVYYTVVMTLFLTPLLLTRGRRTIVPRGALWKVALSGIFFGIMIVTHMVAISQTQAAHMIALKRMTALFGALYGGLYFREGNMAYRLTGAALMVLGAVLVSL
jgi:drug/metabolite transporter (DMT)-like permease